MLLNGYCALPAANLEATGPALVQDHTLSDAVSRGGKGQGGWPGPVPVPPLLPLARGGGHLHVTPVFGWAVLICWHKEKERTLKVNVFFTLFSGF